MTRTAVQATCWTTALLLASLSLAVDPSPRRDRGWLDFGLPPAAAVSARSNLSIEAELGESFQEFMLRAETIAQAEIDDRFSKDITISRVSLVVLGQNGGLSAPLLSLEIKRSDWRRSGDITQYARYYPDSRTLLGLVQPVGGGSQALGTGDVQVTLRWVGSDDLDLSVTGPSGETVFYGNSQIASGGTLDVDANGGCQEETRAPVENVYWPTGGAPTGSYEAVVNLFTRCNTANSAPIPFILTVLLDSQEQTFNGNVTDNQSSQAFRFEFGTN